MQNNQNSSVQENIIEIKNLFFSYSKNKPNVINNVSFSVAKGSYTCIIGHNGSGKSTISKLMTGILMTKSGTIKIDKIVLNKKNMFLIKPKISIVFQNPENQFIGNTVSDDIAFGLENSQVPNEKMQDIILKAAKQTKIDKLLNSEPANLSGGQKQRVAIASALVLDSDIIIFDEATSMLDPKGKIEIKEIMLQLRKNTSKTIISITHDMNEIVNADQILVFNQGILELNDTPKNIFAKDEYLKKIMLNTPDILQFIKEMQQQGINIPTTLNQKELISNLTKLFAK